MDEKMNRKNNIAKAQFEIIQITGQLSGDVKNILTSEEKTSVIQSVSNVNKELTSLVLSIHKLSDSLKLDFNKIIGG